MTYPAHIRYDNKRKKILQTVQKHCKVSASYASIFSLPTFTNTAYLSGLLHDMGKFTSIFKDYITSSALGEKVRKGSVNHTFAGVRFVFETWYSEDEDSYTNGTCELMAYAIGAHHGLFDCFDSNGKDGFFHRLSKKDIAYEEAKNNFLAQCADYDELNNLFEKAKEEVKIFMDSVRASGIKSQEEFLFHTSLGQRILLSSVLEADRRDTFEFMTGKKTNIKINVSKEIWLDKLTQVENKLSSLSNDSEISKARSLISDICLKSADRGSGIYTLSVPTGGGKTLTSLRYALATCAANEKRRIFFVVPLLSVLEQNAKVIRESIDDESFILEHHSNVVQEKNDSDNLDENELLSETWNAPIVITTLVQFLNTLFSGKTSCIRRMQSLADSVIIIDEVHSVPRKLLSLFTMSLNFLSKICKTTIVLCSATNPHFEKINHPIYYSQNNNLVPYDEKIWNIFRRTKILDKSKAGGYTDKELAEFAIESMHQSGSTLLICNTKRQAKKIFEYIENLKDVKTFHLSTSMCMAHRIQTLEEINKCLDKKTNVICVSTQLVEAGVDFSFGSVIRILAGIDNIVQAAGRCNRNGESKELSPVYIVNYKGENLKYLKEIEESKIAAEYVISQYAREPQNYANDLASDTAVCNYYIRLYTDMPKGSHNYPIKKYDTTLYELLSR